MKKKKSVISNKVWLLISFLAAMLVWYLLSLGKATGRSFPFADKVVPSVKTMIDRGAFFKQYVMRGSGIWSWLYHIPSGCFSDGMVHTGSEDHRAMDQFYP